MVALPRPVRQQIEERTTEYLDHADLKGHTEDEKLESLAQVLVKARRERAATRRWPISTSQVRYRCTIEKCANGQKVRNTFDELWNHISAEHFPKDQRLPPRAAASQEQRDIIEKIIESGQIRH